MKSLHKESTEQGLGLRSNPRDTGLFYVASLPTEKYVNTLIQSSK